MEKFEELGLTSQLQNGVNDLGLVKPTAIQAAAFPVVLSGKDVVGIAQTGTGKTLAYMLPILQKLKFSKQINPRVMVMVPTRELVLQVVDMINAVTTYVSVRALGVYGDTNIKTQAQAVAQGADIIVATPGRLYDLILNRSLQTNGINKVVIDEVDVMLDLGFRFQLNNILELLPEKRQNIMFSATMTKDVEELIDDTFMSPEKISIAVSGTPLDNIAQSCYPVHNFYTKANLLSHLLSDKKEFSKVLVFVSSKKVADRLYECLQAKYLSGLCVIHSNKSQNYRIRSVEEFDEGVRRILIATDVIARGLDMDKITHVINFDTPNYPENYMHRIGRTGRAEEQGKTILFYTEKEEPLKLAIEDLMNFEIPQIPFPEEVEINRELVPEERANYSEGKNYNRNTKLKESGPSTHEKKEKNKKENLGGSYKRKLAAKHKKPQRRADNGSRKKK